jgi:hypothetical protein
MTLSEELGYGAAALGVAMLAMQTMVPLRITGIAHNVASIAFGLLAGIYPTVLQHAVLLPLNGYRLFEMVRLIRQVKAASAGDYSMDWLKPFMTRRAAKAGDVLFRKGDEADRMYFVVSGRLRIAELAIDVLPGTVVGELGFLSPDRKRTQTLECTEDCALLQIAYDRVQELHFQNPTFGFYFLRLTTARLFQNIGKLEAALAERDAEIHRLRLSATH